MTLLDVLQRVISILNHWIGELGLGDLWDRVTETTGSGPGDPSSA